MSTKTNQAEQMLFNYGSTYRTDFQTHEIKQYPPTVYKPKEIKDTRHPYQPKNNESLLEYKKQINIPFNMYWEVKPIIRTKPTDKPKLVSTEAQDSEREQVQATRPRLVMTPAISMDDIADKNVRKFLIKDFYSSTTHTAMEEAVELAHYKTIRAPLPDLPASANSVSLPRIKEPVVPAEWRRETVSWDNRQLRSYVDPDREFWRRVDLYKSCMACKETAQAVQMRKLQTGRPKY